VAERDACSPYLVRELALLEDARVLVALGKFAFDALCRHYDVRPRPVFGHGSPVRLPQGRHILGCYHPSQQNTFTGRLTEAMLDEVLSEARRLASPRPGPAGG
jgi:uracil-DNA glycosylase